MVLNYLKQKVRQKRFDRSISYKQNQTFFNDLYYDIDGYEASRQSKDNLKQSRYIYGEVEFYCFSALLSLIKPKPEDVFIDLGSGVGKACVSAALAFNVHQCIGIEIVPKLHQLAQKVYQRCPSHLQNQLHFICDDYLNQNLFNATIVFTNATALFGEDWQQVERQLIAQLPKGASVLVSSKKLPEKYFKHLAMKAVMMDYGLSHINLYIKIA